MIGATWLARTATASEAQPALARGKRFEAGSLAPYSATYLVTHDAIDGAPHACSHTVTMRTGMHFPVCRGCQDRVHYTLLNAQAENSQPIMSNENFHTSVFPAMA
ncbi:hypothetical protein ACOBR2_03350 [Telmatobacter bradus]|uniref:hypothetical protein n=1 Tax=Telmatobacter bradus TaxID=474953 RepID=UPI003B428C5A